MEPDCLGQCTFQSVTDSLSHWGQVFIELSVPILYPGASGDQGLLSPLRWEETYQFASVKRFFSSSPQSC